MAVNLQKRIEILEERIEIEECLIKNLRAEMDLSRDKSWVNLSSTDCAL